MNITTKDWREKYAAANCYPTSPNGDMMLILAHIRYWSGDRAAESASIKPSRGNSYRVARYGHHEKNDLIVRVTDPFDHRDGVTGYRT